MTKNKKQNREQKKEKKNHTLKKKGLSSLSKLQPASNQTKIKKFF